MLGSMTSQYFQRDIIHNIYIILYYVIYFIRTTTLTVIIFKRIFISIHGFTLFYNMICY